MIIIFCELGKCYPCFTDERTEVNGRSVGYGMLRTQPQAWEHFIGRVRGWKVLWVKEITWLRSKGWGVQWHHPEGKGMAYFHVSWALAVLEKCVKGRTDLKSVSVLSVGIRRQGIRKGELALCGHMRTALCTANEANLHSLSVNPPLEIKLPIWQAFDPP